MPETPQSEYDPAAGSVAVATPPAPPVGPPALGVSAHTPDPRRRRMWWIISILVALVACALLGVVLALLFGRSPGSGTAERAVTLDAFSSAMGKAGVRADAPPSQVNLTDVQATGGHPFSATFSPDEITALLATFPYTASVAGISIAMDNLSMSIPEPGVIKISALVTANGASYNGSVTLPLVFSDGVISSTGATALSVEGIPGTGAQRAQVTDALLNYFNAYISAAPGLKVDSARVVADGVEVTGTAPDTLSYP